MLPELGENWYHWHFGDAGLALQQMAGGRLPEKWLRERLEAPRLAAGLALRIWPLPRSMYRTDYWLIWAIFVLTSRVGPGWNFGICRFHKRVDEHIKDVGRLVVTFNGRRRL